jgi:Rrf2 family iron-sulfur cluster assembly transcriptional regulator
MSSRGELALSQTGRYALRILGFLADHPGEFVQGREIAARTSIPANYLSKILNQLRKSGFVDSQRGWGGGFLLPERAKRARIAEVLEAIDGPRDKGACLFELRRCDRSHPCPLHNHWEKVRERYESMLRSVSLGDLRTRPPK